MSFIIDHFQSKHMYQTMTRPSIKTDTWWQSHSHCHLQTMKKQYYGSDMRLVVSQHDAQRRTLPKRLSKGQSSADHPNALATQLCSCHCRTSCSAGNSSMGGTRRSKGCAASSCPLHLDCSRAGLEWLGSSSCTTCSMDRAVLSWQPWPA